MVEFRLLGPVELWVDGQRYDLAMPAVHAYKCTWSTPVVHRFPSRRGISCRRRRAKNPVTMLGWRTRLKPSTAVTVPTGN